MLCLESEGKLVFNDKCFHFCAGDILILTLPDRLKNLGASPNLKVEYFAAPYKFLNNQLPSNSFAIGGASASTPTPSSMPQPTKPNCFWPTSVCSPTA